MTQFNRNYIVSARNDNKFASAAQRMCFDFDTFLRAIESSKTLQATYAVATEGQRQGTVIRFLALMFSTAKHPVKMNAIKLRKGMYRYAWSKTAEFHDLPKDILMWITSGIFIGPEVEGEDENMAQERALEEEHDPEEHQPKSIADVLQAEIALLTAIPVPVVKVAPDLDRLIEACFAAPTEEGFAACENLYSDLIQGHCTKKQKANWNKELNRLLVRMIEIYGDK